MASHSNPDRRESRMPFSGFYINMDKSKDRDQAMRTQLEALSLMDRYSRFPAVDGTTQSRLTYRSAGEVGCFLSHYLLLRQNIGSLYHLHVMEDDAVLSLSTAEVIERIVVTGGILQEYDIIMTEADLGNNIEMISYYKNIVAASLAETVQEGGPVNIQVLDISNKAFCCTSSLLINNNSISKICGLLESELSGAIRQPVDLFVRFLANNGYLRIGVTMPFITSVPIHSGIASTIRNRDRNLPSLLIRRALFLNCDAKACLKEAARCSGPKSDDRDEVILAAFRLCLSPDYVMA
jgi:GR25 family glycosyltransferase involved in LPS biosynthesis